MQSRVRFSVLVATLKTHHVLPACAALQEQEISREEREADEAKKRVISASAEEGRDDGKKDERSENGEECVFHHWKRSVIGCKIHSQKH